MLLIAKVDLALTVREASKLLEIPYTSAKLVCREFIEENKILSKTQMKRHKKASHTSFKIEQSTFARLRREILAKLEQFVTRGTFSKYVVERVQMCSVDAILYYSHTEGYMDSFNDIVDSSGSYNLPIPHTYGFPKSELLQPWYPEGNPKHDLRLSSENMKASKTEKEIVTAEMHEFIFGQEQNPKTKGGNSSFFDAVCQFKFQ